MEKATGTATTATDPPKSGNKKVVDEATGTSASLYTP